MLPFIYSCNQCVILIFIKYDALFVEQKVHKHAWMIMHSLVLKEAIVCAGGNKISLFSQQ